MERVIFSSVAISNERVSPTDIPNVSAETLSISISFFAVGMLPDTMYGSSTPVVRVEIERSTLFFPTAVWV